MEQQQKIFIIGPLLIVFALILLAFLVVPLLFPEKEIAGGGKKTLENGLIEGTPDVPGDCMAISDSIQRQKCFDRKRLSEILYASKNIKECLNLSDLSLRNDCLFRMARIRLDARYCQKLVSASERSRCVQDIAINSNNAQLCNDGDDNVYETQECADRVKATNIGKSGETSLPLDYCAKIKTLEYGKLCVLYASRNGVELTGSTGETGFTQSLQAMTIYRSAETEADCQKIEFDGGREACIAMIKDSNFDYDQDGISDSNELWFGTDPSKKDTDGDGLSDYDEMAFECDPSASDTDRDGLSDNDEVKIYNSLCGNPDSDKDGTKDGDAVKSGRDPVSNDADHDGLADDIENKIGTDPDNSDTDRDGMPDGEEWNNGLDPLQKGQNLFDTDGDLLPDIEEIFYGTDRFRKDTDGDGTSDYSEVSNLSNPLGQGDMDFDMDGLSDIREAEEKTNPGASDTDSDGKPDLNEVMGSSDPLTK